MLPDVLMLQLVRVPRDPVRASEALVLDGPRAGQRLGLQVPGGLPPWLRRNVVFMARGQVQGGVLVAEGGGLGPAPADARVLDVLVRQGWPDVDPVAVLRAAGCVSLHEAAVRCASDPEGFVRSVSPVAGGRAGELARWLARVLEDQAFAEVVHGLGSVGLDLPAAVEVYGLLEHRAARRGVTVWDLIRSDPWVILQVEGVGMRVADALAERLGRGNLSVERALGAAFASAWAATRDGHAYARARDVKRAVVRAVCPAPARADWDYAHGILRLGAGGGEATSARGLLRLDFRYADEVAEDWVRWHAERGREVSEDDARAEAQAVYLRGAFFAELGAARLLARLARAEPQPALDPEAFLADALAACPWLDPGQRQAVRQVARGPLTVVTGAAGTGKTEVVVALAVAARAAGLRVTLMAPSAVAAQRAGRRAGVPGATMHAALRVLPEMEDYADPDDGPAGSEASGEQRLDGLVIVDEAGMAGLVPFRRLLDALAPGARLVLVGDPAQLGAVGPGDVLGSLLAACGRRLLPEEWSVRLEVCHRASALVENAGRIRRGEAPVLEPGVFEHVVVPCGAQGVAAPGAMRSALDGVLASLAREGVPWRDVLVLSPLRGEATGREGVGVYNLWLQARWNSGGEPVPGTRFRVGDRVVCVKNDYPPDGARGRGGAGLWRHPGRGMVANGMLGWVVSCDPFSEEAVVEYALSGGEVRREPYRIREMARWLELGYALTVHKAQGAESPVVVLLEHARERRRCTRRLLYTAVTRAKYDPDRPWSERVVLVGPEGFVEAMARNEDLPRRGKLVYRLAAEMAAAPVERPGWLGRVVVAAAEGG